MWTYFFYFPFLSIIIISMCMVFNFIESKMFIKRTNSWINCVFFRNIEHFIFFSFCLSGIFKAIYVSKYRQLTLCFWSVHKILKRSLSSGHLRIKEKCIFKSIINCNNNNNNNIQLTLITCFSVSFFWCKINWVVMTYGLLW